MKTKILNVLAILVGLMLLNSGLNKIFNYLPMPADIHPEMAKDGAALMEISWLMPLIAVAEIIGGIMLFFPRFRALGILIVFPVMVGILLTHLIVDPSTLLVAVVMWAIFIWLIYEDRHKFLQLIEGSKKSL